LPCNKVLYKLLCFVWVQELQFQTDNSG
jgi:hypothetical protein